MHKSLIAASLLAIGMASSAFAQSNPDTIGQWRFDGPEFGQLFVRLHQ